MRISREEMFMLMAEAAAKRSTCLRRKVGAVITDFQGMSVLAIGYNGNARGLPNTCDKDVPGDCGCIHAEINSLIKAPFHSGALVLYTTTAPCLDCSKLILNSKVIRVVFDTPYRLPTGLTLLQQNGLEVLCIKDIKAEHARQHYEDHPEARQTELLDLEVG